MNQDRAVNFVDSDMENTQDVEQELTVSGDATGENITLTPEQLKMYMKMLRKKKSKNTKKSPLTPKKKKAKRKSVNKARKNNRK
jgi:hypothetical protein